jgi:hypothetical protein
VVRCLGGSAADERELRAVGRPVEFVDAELAVGDRHGFAAGGIHHVELRRAFDRCTKEGDEPAVGRELRGGVAEAARESFRCSMPRELDRPELSDVGV